MKIAISKKSHKINNDQVITQGLIAVKQAFVEQQKKKNSTLSDSHTVTSLARASSGPTAW